MPGLIRGIARTAAIAGTATAVSNRVSRRQAGRWARQEQQEFAAAAQADYAPQPEPVTEQGGGTDSGTDARIARLKELGALKEQGVLTEAEFAAEKARILAR